MTMRTVQQQVRGRRAIDGAGVHLVRVLGRPNVIDFDPFLMLDSFDSTNPADYTAGFPMHPHRGIETVTYLISGEIDHEDSLGNKGVINSGESQWMTAGGGILHQEMPQPSERMLGFQLWLNLPSEQKMCEPAYLGITPDMIPVVKSGNAEVRVISGQFEGTKGTTPRYIQASIFDISLPAGETLELPSNADENAFVFLIEGDAIVAEELISEKTAALMGDGDTISLAAPKDQDARIIYFSGKPLGESIAWGGPIVMNTEDELNNAFIELERGTFIK